MKKDRIDGIISTLYGPLLGRIRSGLQRDQEKNMFILQLGVKFIEQDFLERRIDGMRYIQEICKIFNTQSMSAAN